MTDNYYEELRVEPGASRDELREAHRQRVSDLEAARDKKGVNESQLHFEFFGPKQDLSVSSAA